MNITMLLDMAADAFGDRIAVGSAAGGQGLSYAALRDASVEGARGIVKQGDQATLAFLGMSGLAVPVAMFAAAYAGVTYAPLNYRLPGEALAP